MSETQIHTSMLGRRTKISSPTSPWYAGYEGMTAEIVNVYQDAEKELRYTFLFEDGRSLDAYASHSRYAYKVMS